MKKSVVRLLIGISCGLLGWYLYSNPFWEIAGVSCKIHTSFYDLQGNTQNELTTKMMQVGPIDPSDGQRYFAFTKWHVSWRYKCSSQGDFVRISAANIKMDIDTQLPRRKTSCLASDLYASEWQRYSCALQEHEEGHAVNAIACAREIYLRLTSNRNFHTRQEADAFVEKEAREVIRLTNQKDIEYDSTTKHGSTQGAHLQ